MDSHVLKMHHHNELNASLVATSATSENASSHHHETPPTSVSSDNSSPSPVSPVNQSPTPTASPVTTPTKPILVPVLESLSTSNTHTAPLSPLSPTRRHFSSPTSQSPWLEPERTPSFPPIKQRSHSMSWILPSWHSEKSQDYESFFPPSPSATSPPHAIRSAKSWPRSPVKCPPRARTRTPQIVPEDTIPQPPIRQSVLHLLNHASPANESVSPSLASTAPSSSYRNSTFPVLSMPSTPTSLRSRSPSISSLETIEDSPEAEEKALEREKLEAIAATNATKTQDVVPRVNSLRESRKRYSFRADLPHLSTISEQ